MAKFESADVMNAKVLYIKGLQINLLIIGGIICIFAIFYKNISEFFKNNISRFSNSRKIVYYTILAAVVYFVFFSFVCLNKYFQLGYHLSDLGIFNQIIWNTSNGRFFYNTTTPTSNFLGTHVAIDLLLFIPFYLINKSPTTLLVLQSFVFAASSIPLYFLAKKILSNNLEAFVFVFLYLISVPIHGANLFEFHEEILAPLFLFISYYFIESDNQPGLYISLILLAFVKENLPITAVFIGLYLVIYKKRYIQGILISIFSLIYLLLVIKVILPLFGRGDLILGGSVYHTISLEKGFWGAITNIVMHPIEMFKFVFSIKKTSYVFMQFFFLLFLPLFSKGRLLLVFPALAIILLSDKGGMVSLYTQNICSVTPTLFYLAIIGFKELKFKYIENIYLESIIIFWLLVFSFIFSIQFDYLKNTEFYTFRHSNNDFGHIVAFLNDIPSTSSIMASNNLGYLVSNRQKLFMVPRYEEPDFIKFFRIPELSKIDYFLFKKDEVEYKFLSNLNSLSQFYYLDTLYNKNNSILIKKMTNKTSGPLIK